MAWFGDGLPSLANLKGQLTNITREVLSEGIVEEIDERSKALNDANGKCLELQELLSSKDAEISLLRGQNCELQKIVVELNAKPKDENDTSQDDDGEVFFWDPLSTKNRNSKKQNHVRQLQEQLAQATVKIRDLETELKRVQKVNSSSLKDDLADGHQNAEFLRAKQDMVNRIIEMEEKNKEAERNTKRIQPDEITLINDFRTVLSKLNSLEKLDLVRGALQALETENEKYSKANKREKSDFDEKFMRPGTVNHETVSLKSDFDVNTAHHRQHDGFNEASSNREKELNKKIEELQDENKRLFTSVEQLDQQHEESIEQLLSLKEEIEKKHQCLQNAYEQLYVDYNQAQEKVAQLEGSLVDSTKCFQIETTCQSVQTTMSQNEDKHVQVNAETTNDRNEESVDKLSERVKNILKNTYVEIEPGETIFEGVAKQYVDTKWKKDVLEKKLTEMAQDLKKAEEMKEDLQVDCENMKAHIASLRLEIQDLKVNLPTIPEANEERVASLEKQMESLLEDMKHLQGENTLLRKENAKFRGSRQVEIRLQKHRGHLRSMSRNRKLTTLEDIPEDSEVIECWMENMYRKLYTAMEENDELRRKMVSLEDTKRDVQNQLKSALRMCKDLDQNIEYLQGLKLNLEHSLRVLTDANNETQEKNKELTQRNEQLESEISEFREMNVENENNEVLKSFDEQLSEIKLSKVTREKGDLEYDILNMRKELDMALNQIDLKDGHIAKLNQENESLTKEKCSLLEQLNAIQDESNDKIDLVNVEKSLLEQEQTEMKEQMTTSEYELTEIKERLRETEKWYKTLGDELSLANSKAAELQSKNEYLQNEINKHEELRQELDRTKSAIEELNIMKIEYPRLVTEVETLRLKESELKSLAEQFAKNADETRHLKSQHEDVEDKYKKVKHGIACLQAEKEELLKHINEINSDNENENIRILLDEKSRENDVLKIDINQLTTEITELQNKLQKTIESNRESADMAKQTVESLSHLIKQKDEEISTLKTALDHAKNNTEMLDDFTTIKNERDELVKLVTIKHSESLQYHSETQRLTQLLNEQVLQVQNLLVEKNANLSQLTEKEAELSWAKNELQIVQQRLKKFEESKSTETCGIVEHFTQASEIALLNEKCNAMEAALIQEQSNTRMLQNQLSESQNKEASAEKELERLRTHLVEMESSYTEEAVIAEETRKELEAKLQQAEEKMSSNSTAYTSASIRANQQVETLQQQMALIIQQRDDIQNKLSNAEDKILSQTASLTNLQIVLEQFQRDKEKDIVAATKRIQSKLNDSNKKQDELTNDIINLKEQLAEAKECLQAASRLSEQLDMKTERIEQLRQEVDRLTELVNTADNRIEEAKQSGEGKVDKTLIKNLLLGYLTSAAADKSSVLRVFSTILDFSETDRERANLNTVNAQNSWFSRLSAGSTVPNKDQEASLTAAFVRFLESESKPKPQLPALPIQTSPLPRPGHSRQHSTSSTQSTLLLSNVNLPTFPDFIPTRNTGSILKEVLKDS